MLLTLHTTLHRYLVQHQTDFTLRRVASDDAPRGTNARGNPLLWADLGLLLDPRDKPSGERRHVLIVPLRRRSVGLLFEQVGPLHEDDDATLALPPLLAHRLAHAWVLGVCLLEDVPTLVLDARQIARHVLRQSATLPQGDPA